MSKEQIEGLVPRLRFPQFQNSGSWKQQKLSDLIILIAPPKKLLTKAYQKKGEFPIIDQSQEPICGWTDDIEALITNDLPLIIFGDHTCVLKIVNKPFAQGADGIKILRAKDLIDPNFLYQYLQGNLIVQEEYKRHFSTFKEKIVLFPNIKSGEQEKIASCLSSLDDLISAENEKLDALKAHKKGLMQQLFPGEGETVPKLRFPEFYNKWNIKCISEFAKVTTGGKDTQNKVENGLYPFFVRSQTVEQIDSFSYDGEAILTSGDGVGVGKNFHYIDGKFDFHQRVYCIFDFSKGVYGKFVYLYFSEHFHKRVMQLSAKNSVDSVRMSMITEMPIALPSLEEQMKIADCLSSLDAHIKEQTEKINALKLHKKGLMQQLFPNTV